MLAIKIRLDGDGVLEGTDPENTLYVTSPITIASLDGGMQSGKPSVAFIIELPDGKTIVAETSLALFQATAKAFAAKFGWVDES